MIFTASNGVALERKPPERTSIVEPYRAQIEEFLKKDPFMSARAIFHRIRESGYPGGITIATAWVKKHRTTPVRSREAFLTLEFQAGECAQVDWGEFGNVFGDGVKIHCFVMVLCFSRLLYIEFTRSEKFEEFIRCHENAFGFFGGVPQECWYDNLTSAVTDRMGPIIRFNAKFMAYMGHQAIHPHACNPARGNEKGRVEDGVKFIRSSFWPGRTFSDFEDLCRQAAQWRDEIANTREHRSTKKIPRLHFDTEEKATLRAVNPHPYDTDEIFSRVVPPNFHILYDTNRYSVPWTLVGITVTVRVNHSHVKIFYNDRFVAKHSRSYKKNHTFSQPEHSKGLLERKPGASRDTWQLSAVKSIGPAMYDYVNFLRSGHRSIRSEVARILALATVYGEAAVNEAASELLKNAVIGVENMELLLKSRYSPSEVSPKPLNFQNSKLNRVVSTIDLRRYDALLFQSDDPIASTESGELYGDGTEPIDPSW
ncbi:MAG: IS21 family transposase [Deltaproteobacteria bacterium]|nr:IS21 family transposase [Deltaproteobacteria bacterium]